MRNLLTHLIGVILVAACSGDITAETTATSTPSPTTTTPVALTTTSTTAPATSSTAIPAATSTVVDSLAPQGSGCTPGSDRLPDGLWYGRVADFDDEGIAFDLACWFTGDAATTAAAEDGEESPPNGYYVRNQNEQLRNLDVEAVTPVLWYLSGDPSDSRQGTFAEWVDFLATQGFRLDIWLTIDEGGVTQIEEQWVP